jgi:hypothetical protein
VVEGVGRQAVANSFVTAVATGAVRELRAAGNRLHSVGPDSSAGLVAGIYVATPAPQVAIDDNTVRRGMTDAAQPTAAWAAIIVSPVSATDRILDDNAGMDQARLRIGDFTFVHGATSTFLLSATHVFAVARVLSELSVRGNRLAARDSRLPLVVVGGGVGTCLFSENHCHVVGERAVEPVHGSLSAHVTNVANNRLVAETEQECLRLFNDSERCVVLGNISSGRITVDGGPVPAPFDQLNIVIP